MTTPQPPNPGPSGPGKPDAARGPAGPGPSPATPQPAAAQATPKPAAGPAPKPAAAPPPRPGPGVAKAAAAQPAAQPGAGAQKPAAAQPAAATAAAAPRRPFSRRPGAALLALTPAWVISMLVHVIVLLSMALVANEVPQQETPRLIQASAPASEEPLDDFVEESTPLDQPQTEQQVVDESVVMPDSSSVTVETTQVVSEASDMTAAALSVELTDFGSETVAPTDLLSTVGVVGGQAAGGLGGRSNTQMRQRLVQTGGGSPDSEKAVEAALKWFINHQLPNGAWSLDLTQCPSCQGQCSHSGKGAKSYPLAGPTALALLPFLGRGYTHRDGPYKRQIELALNAIATKVVLGKGNAGEGSYVQGLVGICLSESYAMTKDPRLGMPAQLAVAYVAASQDPVGGGWGYGYRSPGDTSILGWNLMALKSGYLASLQIDPLAVKRAVGFLNSVQTDEGSGYGYRDPGSSLPLSAAGLLCRMYLGWKKDQPALNRGADRIAKAGPSPDLYYDYYATQVLHHLEGERWRSWNDRMRDMLVSSQAKSGHEAGSWYDGVSRGHGPEVAGRIYCTSLATMILEVYYRHLPLYGQESVDEFKE